MSAPAPRALFVDIGGVLLTNGWDHGMRRAAAERFDLDYEEMNERHHLTFDTYEEGKLSLDQYLDRVVFFQERPFSREDFIEHMHDQSRPHEEMLDLVRRVKQRHGLKITAVSNEGRELTEHRVRRFQLDSLIDFFVSSCFVHLRKPDEDIYRLALDCTQVRPEETLYVDDRPLFVQVAGGMGIDGIVHEEAGATRAEFQRRGLID